MGLRDSVAAMLEAVQSLDGLQVSLIRDNETTTNVNALMGETVQAIDDGSGAVIEARSRDFIIFKTDYKFGGIATQPLPDDFICDSSSGEPLYYQVLPFFGQEQKRWSDPFGEAWRIHTKLASEPPSFADPTLDSEVFNYDSTLFTVDAG